MAGHLTPIAEEEIEATQGEIGQGADSLDVPEHLAELFERCKREVEPKHHSDIIKTFFLKATGT